MVVKKVTKSKKKPAKKVAAKSSAKKVAPKKVSKIKKTTHSKVAKTRITGTVANNKSKIAPYKAKKNEKYMSAAMKRHFVAVLLMERTFKRRNAKNF